MTKLRAKSVGYLFPCFGKHHAGQHHRQPLKAPSPPLPPPPPPWPGGSLAASLSPSWCRTFHDKHLGWRQQALTCQGLLLGASLGRQLRLVEWDPDLP